MITVLLVDDHDLVRAGVSRLLSDIAGIKVIGEVSNGEEAVKFVKEKAPHVVLMDVKMPGMGGLEATRKMLRHDPAIKIVALTVCAALTGEMLSSFPTASMVEDMFFDPKSRTLYVAGANCPTSTHITDSHEIR